MSRVGLWQTQCESRIGSATRQPLSKRRPVRRKRAPQRSSLTVVVAVTNSHEKRATARIVGGEARANAPTTGACLTAPPVVVRVGGALYRAGHEQRHTRLIRQTAAQPRGSIGDSHRPAIEKQFALTAWWLGDQVDYAAESLPAIKRGRGALDDLDAFEV